MFYQCLMGVNTMEDVADKMNIKELVEFERYCIDCGLWDKFRSCYFDDGYVTDCWFRGSIDSYTEALCTSIIPVKHKVFNTIVWKSGSKAVAECLALYESRCAFDNDMVDLSAHIRFHYHLEKRDGIWRILTLTPIYEKDTMRSMYTNGSFHIPRNQLDALRTSYANVILLQGKYGRIPNTTLPGEDMPETIHSLYIETSSWLGI